MKRIFIKNIKLGIQKLDKENLNYLKNTLRFRSGDKFLVFNGEYEAESIYKETEIEILQITKKKESTYLKLAIAEIKKERLEWLVEKATELGVSEIILLTTQRTQSFINTTRLQKIILAACMQSGRISIPNLQSMTFNQFIEILNPNEWVFGSLNSSCTNIQSKSTVGAIIGPEGGWSYDEETSLQKKINSIYLNSNILRSETAAIVTLSSINYVQQNKKHLI